MNTPAHFKIVHLGDDEARRLTQCLQISYVLIEATLAGRNSASCNLHYYEDAYERKKWKSLPSNNLKAVSRSC